MSLLLSFNILTVLSITVFFTGFDPAGLLLKKLSTIFSSELLIKFLWSMIVLFIPSMMINYYCIFYKKQYNNILKNYEYKRGTVLLTYFIVTVIILFGFSVLNTFKNDIF